MNGKCGRLAGALIGIVPLLTVISVGPSRNRPHGPPAIPPAWCICQAAETEEIFAKDIGKQKETIEKEFDKLDEVLSSAKLQEARSTLDVLEYKVGRIKKNLTKREYDLFRQRIDNKKKAVPVKEDSLVARAFELIRTQGVDAALAYTQQDLRTHGVAEKKVNSLEKKILKDAPAIQQGFEREEIARVIKILENGGLPDSTVNPYILKSARMIIQAKADSVQRIEQSRKLKEMDHQEQADMVRMKKEIREMQEKNKEEERLSRMKRHEDDGKRTEAPAAPSHTSDSTGPESAVSAQHEKQDTVMLAPEHSEKAHDDLPDRSGVKPSAPPENNEIPDAQLPAQAVDRRQDSVQAVPENPESKSAQAYLQTLKSHRQEAREKVMELYDLLESRQGVQALEKFKHYRGFIAEHVDPQVFTLLEQTIMRIVMESTSPDSSKNTGIENSGVRLGRAPEIAIEQEHLNRINGYLRDNKVEAAYAEFKRSEGKLKKYMDKNEFKQFKKMVENSYKTRHPAH